MDTVREIGLALPDVKETTTWGKPTLKVRGRLLACVPSHKSAEAGSLVVAMDFEQRAALLAEAPEAYYITDHYAGYPGVLVRMSRIRVDQLRDLLGAAWRFATATVPARSRSRDGVARVRSAKKSLGT